LRRSPTASRRSWLHDALGVEIPETDYPKLATLKGAVDYLAATVHHV
jgi:hypothetical protein